MKELSFLLQQSESMGNSKPNEDRYMSRVRKMLKDRDVFTAILLKHGFEQQCMRKFTCREGVNSNHQL